jgi:putative membrane protein
VLASIVACHAAALSLSRDRVTSDFHVECANLGDEIFERRRRQRSRLSEYQYAFAKGHHRRDGHFSKSPAVPIGRPGKAVGPWLPNTVSFNLQRREVTTVMTRWHDGLGPGAWIAMAFVMLVFWALVVAAIIALVRSNQGRERDRSPVGRADDPGRILDERFARGEIDADEYKQRRDVLRSS